MGSILKKKCFLHENHVFLHPHYLHLLKKLKEKEYQTLLSVYDFHFVSIYA